jgi:two-component system sensor histidine kinase UhpB
MALKRSTLTRRVFLVNAAIFVVATLALVITPATVSFPVELTEALVLVLGLAAILVLNAVALRAAFAPLRRLGRVMREVDPRRPGVRLDTGGPEEMRELVSVYNAMLDRLEAERRESGRIALAAQEGERRRVAQELHDDVGQLLTGILARLESIARRAPSDLEGEIRETQDAAREAIDHVSAVVRSLRPEALADLGLARSLAALAARVEQESALRVRHRIEPGLEGLDEEQELVVYRVAQESLTNAVRHSSGGSVELTLGREGGDVVLRIRDDGVGLPPTLPDRHGIVGMRERATAVGATLSIATREPGVEVRLAIPMPA